MQPVRKLLSVSGLTFAQRFRGHSAPIYSLAWRRDGQRLASSSYDGTVRIWDPASGEQTANLAAGSAVFAVGPWQQELQGILNEFVRRGRPNDVGGLPKERARSDDASDLGHYRQTGRLTGVPAE